MNCINVVQLLTNWPTVNVNRLWETLIHWAVSEESVIPNTPACVGLSPKVFPNSWKHVEDVCCFFDFWFGRKMIGSECGRRGSSTFEKWFVCSKRSKRAVGKFHAQQEMMIWYVSFVYHCIWYLAHHFNYLLDFFSKEKTPCHRRISPVALSLLYITHLTQGWVCYGQLQNGFWLYIKAGYATKCLGCEPVGQWQCQREPPKRWYEIDSSLRSFNAFRTFVEAVSLVPYFPRTRSWPDIHQPGLELNVEDLDCGGRVSDEQEVPKVDLQDSVPWLFYNARWKRVHVLVRETPVSLPETNRHSPWKPFPLEVWRFLLETTIFGGYVDLLVSGRAFPWPAKPLRLRKKHLATPLGVNSWVCIRRILLGKLPRIWWFAICQLGAFRCQKGFDVCFFRWKFINFQLF